MTRPRFPGAMPRLDDLLLIAFAAWLAIVLIRPGQGAQGARDFIKARTVAFQSLRLTLPKVPNGTSPPFAVMSVRPNGRASLSFMDLEHWLLRLEVDQSGTPFVGFSHNYQSELVISLALSLLSSSGSPSFDLRRGDGSRSAAINMPNFTPTMSLVGLNGTPVMIYAGGPAMGQSSIRLESRSEHSLLSLDYVTDRQSSILLAPKIPAPSSMLGIPKGGPPGLELRRDDPLPAVGAGLDATERSFIQQNDRTTGQSLTIR